MIFEEFGARQDGEEDRQRFYWNASPTCIRISKVQRTLPNASLPTAERRSHTSKTAFMNGERDTLE